MQRAGKIGIAVGGVILAAASFSVLSRGPQSAVPLAIEAEPTAVAETPSSPPPAPPEPPPVVPEVINNGPREAPKVALTFDTSYDSTTAAAVATGYLPRQFDPQVLDVLANQQAPATVFVTGLWAQDHPDAMARMVEAGDAIEIGNHSWSHNAWTTDCYGLPYVGDLNQQRAEIEVAAAKIGEFTGAPPRLFRFPGLCSSPEGVVLAAELGEQPIGVDVQYNDAFVTDPRAGAEAILSQVGPGAIVGLHLNGAPNAPATAAMVELLVPALRERGYELVTVGELLSGDPGGQSAAS